MSLNTARPDRQAPRRLAAGALGIAAYAVASHLLMVHAAGKAWAVLALLGPFVAIGLVAAWRTRNAALGAAMLAAAALLLVVIANGGVRDMNLLYVLQHIAVHLALFAGFAATLRPGHVPLISRLAIKLHKRVTPALLAYTRRVTHAWVAYFASMSAASVIVYLSCEWSTWSALANLATPLAIAGLFGGEYLLRHRLHPEFERISVTDIVHAYRNEGAAAPTAPR